MLSMGLAGHLTVQDPLIGFHGQEEVGALLLEELKKRSLGVERICLDQNALEIQLPEQRFEHRPLVVIAARGCRIQRHLGNECRTTNGCGLDRASQGLAVTHQRIEIRCTTGDLIDRPVSNRSAESRHVHLAEEVAEG
ncbi:MAG: hypothetical protein VKO39_08675 [Cyanobacteriota bacterium]|nr:hypothetical protein [Cyanobacteriota bacterium]